MSLQITVWALWFLASRVIQAAASSGLTSGGFIASDSTSHPLLFTHPSIRLPSLSLSPFPPTHVLYSGLLQKDSIMEAGCVVAAVIENAASGPQGEPGSSDVLEGWVTLFFSALMSAEWNHVKNMCDVYKEEYICVCACRVIYMCVCTSMRCYMNKSRSSDKTRTWPCSLRETEKKQFVSKPPLDPKHTASYRFTILPVCIT